MRSESYSAQRLVTLVRGGEVRKAVALYGRHSLHRPLRPGSDSRPGRTIRYVVTDTSLSGGGVLPAMSSMALPSGHPRHRRKQALRLDFEFERRHNPYDPPHTHATCPGNQPQLRPIATLPGSCSIGCVDRRCTLPQAGQGGQSVKGKGREERRLQALHLDHCS